MRLVAKTTAGVLGTCVTKPALWLRFARDEDSNDGSLQQHIIVNFAN